MLGTTATSVRHDATDLHRRRLETREGVSLWDSRPRPQESTSQITRA
jgi:hypothetical protein